LRDEPRVSVEITRGQSEESDVVRVIWRYQHSPFPRLGSDSSLKRNSYSGFVLAV